MRIRTHFRDVKNFFDVRHYSESGYTLTSSGIMMLTVTSDRKSIVLRETLIGNGRTSGVFDRTVIPRDFVSNTEKDGKV